jgi:hypothetical protein
MMPDPATRRPRSLRDIYRYLYQNPRVRITVGIITFDAEYWTTRVWRGHRALVFRLASGHEYPVPVCGPIGHATCPLTGDPVAMEVGIVWKEGLWTDQGFAVSIGDDLVKIEYRD